MLTDIKNEAHLLAIKTVMELIVKFDKILIDAENIVKSSKREEFIVQNPITLHESAYNWAVKLLTEIGDLDTLEKYLT
ncbi:protein of unknown function [Acetoanaerobium sticklandii]|uniref:Uncharacterized protein n=1 Tax=Acetoanaerobium sticklandii (strain ATCC 12662 / DSM 519 / JCM 1433 / CCUG 9281 / NCIMB 10654 / HF) TaxID=499177 RepID=E3PY63_ACESD|nr:hypothetical protein [Acetoanaerobium sticklandii]CBH21378.1 protein of unknown function [Acetoanaerobium sticklandii]